MDTERAAVISKVSVCEVYKGAQFRNKLVCKGGALSTPSGLLDVYFIAFLFRACLYVLYIDICFTIFSVNLAMNAFHLPELAGQTCQSVNRMHHSKVSTSIKLIFKIGTFCLQIDQSSCPVPTNGKRLRILFRLAIYAKQDVPA